MIDPETLTEEGRLFYIDQYLGIFNATLVDVFGEKIPKKLWEDELVFCFYSTLIISLIDTFFPKNNKAYKETVLRNMFSNFDKDNIDFFVNKIVELQKIDFSNKCIRGQDIADKCISIALNNEKYKFPKDIEIHAAFLKKDIYLEYFNSWDNAFKELFKNTSDNPVFERFFISVGFYIENIHEHIRANINNYV